jgi:hypothetical protein
MWGSHTVIRVIVLCLAWMESRAQEVEETGKKMVCE